MWEAIYHWILQRRFTLLSLCLRHVISRASTPLTFLLSHTFREVRSRDVRIVCPRPKIQSRTYFNIYKIWATRTVSYDTSVYVIVFSAASYSLYAWVQNHVHVLVMLVWCVLPAHIFYTIHQGCTNFVLWRLIVVDPQSWTLLLDTHLAPKIWRWFLDSWKMYIPLL